MPDKDGGLKSQVTSRPYKDRIQIFNIKEPLSNNGRNRNRNKRHFTHIKTLLESFTMRITLQYRNILWGTYSAPLEREI